LAATCAKVFFCLSLSLVENFSHTLSATGNLRFSNAGEGTLSQRIFLPAAEICLALADIIH
jgi:hypothetical protein